MIVSITRNHTIRASQPSLTNDRTRVVASMLVAVATLRFLYTVRDVVIPHASATPAVYVHIHASESTAYHARMLDLAPEWYTPTVRMRLEMGRYVMAQDYLLALEGQQALRREVDAALSDVDALLLPSMPIPAQPIGADTVLVDGSTELVRPAMQNRLSPFRESRGMAIHSHGPYASGLTLGLVADGR